MPGTSRARVHLAVRALSLALVVGSVASAPGCASRRNAETDDPAAPDASPADKHYDVAVGSFHNGMFEDAKLQLDRALRADPDHADSYYLQGVLLLNEARTLVDAVESQQCLQDDAAELQRQRAQQLHSQARESFATAATRYPEGAAGRGRANNSLAVVSLFFQENEAAIEHSRAALEQQFYADRYSALANLGWAYYNLGDLVSATNELRQSVLLNPDFCVGRYRLAQVYLDSGLIEQAVEQAMAVVDDPRCPIQDAHRILGVASLRLGDELAARDAFGSCVTMAPRSCLAQDCRRFLGSEPSAADAIAQAPP
ncbi:tetratricopeptide repeat protein [Paraliomyxa miuraensis]|uniref:tetratricopeptide repeat protein n=1 Tax=Paraliomyxa miuraensis TaxID=376150 RepID=UPI0022578F9B|nr:tetratricopeptide repeat protein [Paraliomyxa miuraensis]MCX4244424.1 tetratricopeptide repeat protein [Paraliomyxa miuraensis]